MLSVDAKGVFAIAPTPFHDDGRIDEPRRPADDLYVEVGCDGVHRARHHGRGAEARAAEADRRRRADAWRARQNMQIIVGVSAPGFAAMRSLARASMDAGAAGVMIAPPPSLRTDDQIVGYFKQAVEAIGRTFPGCCRTIR